MKYRMPVYYSDFCCIGAACEDTCCGGWKIAIDKKSYEAYQNVSGNFGERLRQAIDAKELSFRMNGRYCALLNQEKLCDIYKELGKESLCETCRTYPRHMEDYGAVRELTLSLSCPEAARIILGAASDGVWREQEKEVRRSRKEKANDPNPKLFACIQEIRKNLIFMVEHSELPLSDRFAMVLSYAHDLQRQFDKIYEERFDKGNCSDDAWRAQCLEQISKRYLKEEAALRFQEKLKPFRKKTEERYIRIFSWMRLLETLEPVLEHWKKKQGIVCTNLYHSYSPESYQELEQEFSIYSKTCEAEWKNLFLYFIHVYLSGACYDEDVYSKVKFAVFSTVIIRQWCLFRYGKTGIMDKETIVAASYRYAREVENSNANLEFLEEHFQDDMQFGLKAMLTVLASTDSIG